MNVFEMMGRQYQDQITGFTGVCIAVVEWMYGCTQVVLQPKATNPSLKAHSEFFFPRSLVEVTDYIGLEGINPPEYTQPHFFGQFCRDKITGVKGTCVGRMTFLVASAQYMLEFQAEDQSTESHSTWLDEGRIEVIPDSTKSIMPEEVQGARPGGVLSADHYPPTMSRVNMISEGISISHDLMSHI